jgi:hypothetical protein
MAANRAEPAEIDALLGALPLGSILVGVNLSPVTAQRVAGWRRRLGLGAYRAGKNLSVRHRPRPKEIEFSSGAHKQDYRVVLPGLHGRICPGL